MVTGTHPEDIDLFDYVEGELPAPRRAELEVHLASCAQCAEQVARVEAGRTALRESQFLQLPPRRREAILRDLPAQRPARRRARPSPKQVLAILTPVAAVAAVAVALVSIGGNGSDEEGAEAAPATLTSQARPEDTGAAEATKAEPLTAAGPASAVADELRRKGFDARVVDNRVEVRDATRAEVERALRDRRVLSATYVKILIFP